MRKLRPKGINNPSRYTHIVLCKNATVKYIQIHRLVAKYFCEGYCEGAVVNHKDCDIHNNKASNLEWVTQKENIHKSYITSGIDQTRNYYHYSLIDSSGNVIYVSKGANDALRFVRENNIDASPSSLHRYGRSRGYRLSRI